MSRPYAWNGTTWKDARFLVGGQWLSYIPPVFDVPQDFLFTSGAEGFTTTGEWAGGWNPGGWMQCGCATTFLTGYAGVRVNHDQWANYGSAFGHALELRARARVRPGTDTHPVEAFWDANIQYPYPDGGISYSGQNSGDEISIPADSVWRDYSQPIGTMPDPQYLAPADALTDVFAALTIRSSRLGGTAAIGHYLDVDRFTLWDVTAGTALMALSDPGWEPKVLTVSDGWV